MNGAALGDHLPPYIVRPTSFSFVDRKSLRPTQVVKIIDFGEAFLKSTAPAALHTPLAVRAPEAMFGDRIDHRVDLWSLGCMVLLLPMLMHSILKH